MYVDHLTLGGQTIHLFDLGITTAERHRRRNILDSELTDYFFDHAQTSYLYHQPGQAAKLRLEPLVLQSLTQPKPVAKQDFRLAISYALPLVAVAWSTQNVALDICQQSAFDTMTSDEIHDFCALYLPALLDNGLPSKIELAKHWSTYEAKLKALSLPLQEFDNQLAERFRQIDSVHESFFYRNQRYWLSLSQTDTTVDGLPSINETMPQKNTEHFNKIA